MATSPQEAAASTLARAQQYIGLRELEALARAEEEQRDVVVAESDGVALPGRANYVRSRVRLFLERGLVVRVDVG